MKNVSVRCQRASSFGSCRNPAAKNVRIAALPCRTSPPRPRAGMQRLRFARCCYDHLAGRVGVAVTQRMQTLGLLAAASDKRFDVTPAGRAWFSELGVDVDGLVAGRRGIATQCLDSIERRHHLAGPLGTQLMRCLCERGWLRRVASSREVQVTPRGWTGLRERLGIDAIADDAKSSCMCVGTRWVGNVAAHPRPRSSSAGRNSRGSRSACSRPRGDRRAMRSCHERERARAPFTARLRPPPPDTRWAFAPSTCGTRA
ncbi:hypothetical protein [Burkholderia oklahomensis]|nr:hypothetical protein [Burkholderia oklahomensis]AOI48235.1 ArsR family transcriptional regulator [Burkholderia oklahomensis C6786]KUY49895.1 ArsR family transcriptional regulator [Burkholderia oklahomensis C6786]